jgi:hypothetical protein
MMIPIKIQQDLSKWIESIQRIKFLETRGTIQTAWISNEAELHESKSFQDVDTDPLQRLSDGELLCQLVNLTQANAIPRYRTNPSLYGALENLHVFTWYKLESHLCAL